MIFASLIMIMSAANVDRSYVCTSRSLRTLDRSQTMLLNADKAELFGFKLRVNMGSGKISMGPLSKTAPFTGFTQTVPEIKDFGKTRTGQPEYLTFVKHLKSKQNDPVATPALSIRLPRSSGSTTFIFQGFTFATVGSDQFGKYPRVTVVGDCEEQVA